MSDPAVAGRHIEALPVALLRRPFEYVLADHLRQRAVLAMCDELAGGAPAGRALLDEFVAFLSGDLVAHIVDEEHDLYPLLRHRAEPGDEIEHLLGRLAADHAADERLAAVAVERLAEAEDGAAVPAGTAEALLAFASHLRSHLLLENAAVLPLARVRLSPRDLAGLSGRMAARRGIVLPRESVTT